MQMTSWEDKKFWPGLDTKENLLYCLQNIHHEDNLIKYKEFKYKIKDQNGLICWLAVKTIKPTMDK